MNGYSVTLFIHIVGALGFFMALGLEWTGLAEIRRAVIFDQVRGSMSLLKNVRKLGFISMLTTVITGIYLMLTTWGIRSWILITLGSLVLVIALAQTVTAPRMAAVGQALAAGKGQLSTNFHTLANHPLLSISILVRVAVALGIVFLKVTKPDMSGSLMTIAVAIVLGLATALYTPRRVREQAGTTN